MAENVTLNPVVTFSNDTTAVNTVNGNYTTITNAFTDVLSRSGVSPNQMNSTLDMNSNQIINLSPPATINSPARLADVVTNPTITVPPTGTSGAVVGFLNGNNTYSGSSTFTGAVSMSGASSLTVPAGSITGSEMATNTIANGNIRQSVGLSVVGNTNNFTANVGDIVGTTRQVLAVNTAGTSVVFAQPRGDQLLGTALNDNATAGNVGEFISATLNQGSAIGITSATATTLTSIALTAGDWDLWGQVNYIPAGTTSIANVNATVNTSTNTFNFANGFFSSFTFPAFVPGNFVSHTISVGPIRVSLSGSATYFLIAQASFTVSTCTAFGNIQARRVR
jgi:hypothetical protein